MDEVVLGLLSIEPGSETTQSYGLFGSPAPDPIFRWKAGGSYECLLCQDHANVEAVGMEYSAKSEHCKDALHLANLERAKKLQRSACQKLRIAQSLSQKMDDTGAPDSLRADLVRYLFNPTLTGLPDCTLECTMKAQLDKFERNEPTTLLELAVWKTACLISIPHPIKDLFEFSEWWRSGWKAGKAKCRRHPLIEAVLTNVAPFLDGPAAKEGLEPSQKRSKTTAV